MKKLSVILSLLLTAALLLTSCGKTEGETTGADEPSASSETTTELLLPIISADDFTAALDGKNYEITDLTDDFAGESITRASKAVDPDSGAELTYYTFKDSESAHVYFTEVVNGIRNAEDGCAAADKKGQDGCDHFELTGDDFTYIISRVGSIFVMGFAPNDAAEAIRNDIGGMNLLF